MILVIPPNHTGRFAFPQMGIVYLASVLKSQNIDVTVFDCQFHPDFVKPLLDAVSKDKTVGFYLHTYSYSFVKGMSKAIKEHIGSGTRIILGGPHASHLPGKLVEDFADIVVSGEGEEVLPRILKGDDLREIPSISYRSESGEIIENPRTDLIRDLDALPFPEWDLLNYRKFTFTHYKRLPLVSMVTSRGCLSKCIYCSSRIVHKQETRMRSVDSVVDEIERNVEKFGIREIHVVDDDFTYDVGRVKDICREIIARKLNKKVKLAKPNAVRSDRGDQEMFDLLKRAGFYFVAIAVEAVNPEVNRKLGRGADLSRRHDTIAMARKAGLFTNTFFLMGSPYDTRETMMENIHFACKSPTDVVSFFMMKPFPGTPLFTHLVKEGKLEDRDHCEIPSCNDITTLYTSGDWDEKELVRLVRYAYRRFYLSPLRFFRLIFRLPMFISNPFIAFKLFLNLLGGGSPASDSLGTREEINRQFNG